MYSLTFLFFDFPTRFLRSSITYFLSLIPSSLSADSQMTSQLHHVVFYLVSEFFVYCMWCVCLFFDISNVSCLSFSVLLDITCLSKTGRVMELSRIFKMIRINVFFFTWTDFLSLIFCNHSVSVGFVQSGYSPYCEL